MAMNVYWSWEKQWVKDMQIHPQRVTIWQWLNILDLFGPFLANPVPRFSASLDSRGVYVLKAPTWRTWSRRMDRTWVFDHQDSSPYTIQDIDDSELSGANDTGSDVEVNLLRDL
jgi:hypothetical protein